MTEAEQENLCETSPLSIPGGIDGVEQAGNRQYTPFRIGRFYIDHVASVTVSVAKVTIGNRTFSCEVEKLEDDACRVAIYDNGKEVVSMRISRGKVTSFMIAVKAMKEYIRQLSGTRGGRYGFLPREEKKREGR